MIFRHLLNMRSHPTWVRGLKHYIFNHFPTAQRSHPTWVRGLKRVKVLFPTLIVSRTLRGCVD